MKSLTYVGAWMCFAFLALFIPQMSFAQSNSVHAFEVAPYASAYGEVIAGDGHQLSEVEEILSYSRVGKTDVKVIFLNDRFYLVFDLMGLRRTYVMTYDDSQAGYQSQLGLNAISTDQMSVEELVNCVLKYYTKA